LELLQQLIIVIVGILAAGTIILYATWLFISQLRHGRAAGKSFVQWLKHIAEAILGL
jgi:hypothetical protein